MGISAQLKSLIKKLTENPRVRIRSAFWLFMIGIYAIVSIPRLGKVFSKYEKQKVESVQIRNMKTQIIEAKEEYQQLDSVLHQIIPETPYHYDLSKYLKWLLNCAKGNQVNFGAIKIGLLESKEGFSLLPLKITVNGQYHNLGLFLNQIERKNRLLVIDEIKIEKLPSGLTATISGKQYFEEK